MQLYEEARQYWAGCQAARNTGGDRPASPARTRAEKLPRAEKLRGIALCSASARVRRTARAELLLRRLTERDVRGPVETG